MGPLAGQRPRRPAPVPAASPALGVAEGSLAAAAVTMRCERHFKSSFGNVKAINLKKIKLSLSRAVTVAAAALNVLWAGPPGAHGGMAIP